MEDLREVLQEFLEKRDNRIQELEEEIAGLKGQLKYEDDWNWRHLREYYGPELPTPRLELQWNGAGFNCFATYGIVYKYFDDEVRFAPLGSTKAGGARLDKLDADRDLPFRERAHIFWDMYHMKLPGYVTGPNGYCRELSIDEPSVLPNKLRTLMETQHDSTTSNDKLPRPQSNT